MNLANKVFRNNKTGESIRVIDSFENIAILENKQKIDVRTLMDSNQYTEQIDPASFFNNQNAYNTLVDKIKSMPTDHIKDDPSDDSRLSSPISNFGDTIMPTTNESAIVMTTEEDEKAELMKKYGISDNSSNDIQRQNEAFSKLIDEEDLPPVPQPVQTPVQNTIEVQRFEVQRDVENTPQPVKQVMVDDPIITMFKKTKRNVDFKINIEVSDKIPRLDFIEMMEDSYEISMIDFLADEFTNKILQDPSMIRNTIKDKIKQLVYGGEIKTPVNPQITDAVTQVNPDKEIQTETDKKTTTRKPRQKKDSTEK